MSSVERKSLDFSIQVYRQLLRLYPKGFAVQFGDQLVQTFGDLARRAMKSGGYLQLLLLWSRMLPDALCSALREHTGSVTWEPISRFRRRWIAGCAFGLMIGTLAANQLRWWGWVDYTGLTLCVGIALGWMQWVWVLGHRPSESREWIVATVAGTLFLPHAVLFVLDKSSPTLTMLGDGVMGLLTGLGVGLFQYRILRRESSSAWTWVPTNALGFLAARYMALSFFDASRRRFSQSAFVSPDLQVVLGSLVAGAVLGYLTSFALESIFARKREPDVNLPAATE